MKLEPDPKEYVLAALSQLDAQYPTLDEQTRALQNLIDSDPQFLEHAQAWYKESPQKTIELLLRALRNTHVSIAIFSLIAAACLWP